MIAKGTYMRGGAAHQHRAASHLTAHMKYIEHRHRDALEHREDRGIFSKDRDQVERKEATRELMEHSSASVSYHKIILSPGEDEPVQDWRGWTREVMADLEEAQGKELHWYAVHHSNTAHEHVHLVLAGAGENLETGREEAVKLSARDYQQLRFSGHEHSEHDFYHRMEEEVQELTRQDDVGRDPGSREQSRALDHDHQGERDR